MIFVILGYEFSINYKTPAIWLITSGLKKLVNQVKDITIELIVI